MKIYKEIEIPAKKETIIDKIKCDLCGKEKDKLFSHWDDYYKFNTQSVEIELREGNHYSGEGCGTKYFYEICPNCFKNVLIPFMTERGAKITEEVYDF